MKNNPRLDILKYRILLNVSQRQLARKLGISQGYLSEIEHCKKSPTLRMLFRIADELSVCPLILICCDVDCETCPKEYKINCDKK